MNVLSPSLSAELDRRGLVTQEGGQIQKAFYTSTQNHMKAIFNIAIEIIVVFARAAYDLGNTNVGGAADNYGGQAK